MRIQKLNLHPRVIRKSILDALDTKKLEIKLFFSGTAIVVYQMAKVGSTTVYSTLKDKLLFTPVFHIHYLSHDAIRELEKSYIRQNKIPMHISRIRHGWFLRKKLDKSENINWKIITLVRDPIAREISIFFQHLDRNFPDGISNSKIVEFLQKKIISFEESTDHACMWFDKELKENFGINIYDFNFDKKKGYSIVKKQGIEVLVIRLEDLDGCINSAFAEFFNFRKPIKLESKNIGKNKKYSQQYTEVLNDISIPKAVCEKIYSSKYSRHFYDNDMLDKFIKRWLNFK